MGKRTKIAQILPDAVHTAVGSLSVFHFALPIPSAFVFFYDLKSF